MKQHSTASATETAAREAQIEAIKQLDFKLENLFSEFPISAQHYIFGELISASLYECQEKDLDLEAVSDTVNCALAIVADLAAIKEAHQKLNVNLLSHE